MYPIREVPDEARAAVEPMGSKPKFWFEHTSLGMSLFKANREGTGEDWAEKLAAEIANELGIPHAPYDLATWRGQRGVITPRLTAESERLVHGNEILIDLEPGYGSGTRSYRTPQHTVGAVARALAGYHVGPPLHAEELPPLVSTGTDVFVGYLLLDAVVCNTDRHHENWAVVDSGCSPSVYSLSPTFDHASSLGRNEPLPRIRDRLTTKDRNFGVSAYVARARSGLYARHSDSRPLTTLEAFNAMACIVPGAAEAWRKRLDRLTPEFLNGISAQVPKELMKEQQKQFFVELVTSTVGTLRGAKSND